MKIRQEGYTTIIKKNIMELIQIIFGTCIMGLGTGTFLVPNKLSTGGFSGIATIFYYLWNLPVGTMMLLLNVPLFIFAFLKNGKKFFFRAVLGTFLLSVFIDLFGRLSPLTEDRILACLYGGILVGVGTAIILRANASTGGSDLLSQIIRKYKPELRSGTLIVITDAIIVILNIIVFKQIEIGLYSTLAIYIMGKVIDIFLEGIYFTKIIYIISDKYVEITEKITVEVKRGTTGIYAKGMYTNNEKMVLLCVAGRNEVARNS